MVKIKKCELYWTFIIPFKSYKGLVTIKTIYKVWFFVQIWIWPLFRFSALYRQCSYFLNYRPIEISSSKFNSCKSKYSIRRWYPEIFIPFHANKVVLYHKKKNWQKTRVTLVFLFYHSYCKIRPYEWFLFEIQHIRIVSGYDLSYYLAIKANSEG